MNHSMDQHRRLYKLLKDNNLMDYRHDMVKLYTGERTDNSSDMTESEISEMIKYVDQFSENTDQDNDFTKGEKMRKRIFSICYQCGWTYFDKEKMKTVVNSERLNSWMIKYSYLHKSLNKYRYIELPKLVEQINKVLESQSNKA